MQRGSLAARLGRSAAIGALLAAFSSALAQTADQPPGQTPPAVDTVLPAEEAADENDRVIVTGSRLPNQFSSASPMDVFTSDQADARGIGDIASLLRSSTVAAGSPQITAVSSTAFVQDGGVGAESLSLRGLGANRTLVLLDGRRAGPAGTRGSVGSFDFNVIPLSAVERVEILKEGASSVYGSDAIAGVINIITKKDDGLNFDGFYSLPEQGGGEEMRFNASWGETIGNLHFRITGDYFKQKKLARGDRDFFDCAQPYAFNANGSRADDVDPRTGKIQCSGDAVWGHVWFYDYDQPGAVSRPWQVRPQLIQFNRNNDLQNYLPGFDPSSSFSIPAGWFPVGYGEIVAPGGTPDAFYGPSAAVSDRLIDYHHPFQDNVSLSPEVERMTIFANGDYDVNDGLKLYGEVLLNRRTTTVQSYRQFFTYQYVYDNGDGSFSGDPLAISQGWTGPNVGFSPLSITDHNDSTIQVDYVRAVAGAQGDLPIMTGWEWNASVQFSRSNGTYKDDIIWEDAVTDQEFRSALCAGTLTRYRGAPCVDINWYSPDFLAGQFTAEERAFLFGTVKGRTTYEQTAVEAYASGELFDLPAGSVSAVIGALYQEDSLNDTPSQVIQDGEAWGDSTAGITKGEDTSTAVYGELGIPILADAPFAKSLNVNLSGRYNDVDSYGSQSTYKIGLNWTVTDEFRFRASTGTSFRSPALFELFLANETGFLRQTDIDPCVNWQAGLIAGGTTQRVADNCAADGIPGNYNGAGATATISSSGGFGRLDAETSDSKSFGVIWSPNFADLQISLDYFDIQVDNEVTKLNSVNILQGCYDSLNFATEPLCALFDRSPAGETDQFNVLTVTDNFLNIATQKNRGIDLDALYRQPLPWGDLTLHAQVSHQLNDEITLLATSPTLDFNGQEGDPKWVGNFDATLDMAPFSFFWGVRYVGETSNEGHFGAQPQTYHGLPVRYVLSTDSILYHNVSVSVEPDEGLTVRLGISNLFDTKPPEVTGALSGEFNTVGNIPVAGGSYDFFGRTVFLNVSKSF